ncbi:hypothetical protein FKF61_21580 [Salmonella enterica]|uniref:Uncharacterized protein n=1 Tax=Salmonella phage F61 TaxID=2982033 RepID=A0A977R8R9_9CAUD|nr:hypothetical protein [Salmonella enterica]QIN92563.1 hypothetical protein [Phage NBSal001]UXM05336.1 hypothetical protein [Salmonella phage F115]UXM05385.1 hypothetical protein [Salmonella phage F61]HBI4576220.1 hypothetical protein [Salmonella enterica subsp. enterica serovar Infantis]
MKENNMSEFFQEFLDQDGDGMSVSTDTFGTTCELIIYSHTGCFPMSDADEVERLGNWLIEQAKYMRAE